DKMIPHTHRNAPDDRTEGIGAENRRRSTLLVFSLTLHNIPEGMAIGIAFGAIASNADPATLAAGAATLALGIGIQNIPEGMAVSMPLRGDGMSRMKSFFFGWRSAIVEPMAAMVGVLAVSFMAPFLPYALSLAAGAMIFVVVEEVIPSTQKNGHSDIAAMSLMVGFTLMMLLDVALGYILNRRGERYIGMYTKMEGFMNESSRSWCKRTDWPSGCGKAERNRP